MPLKLLWIEQSGVRRRQPADFWQLVWTWPLGCKAQRQSFDSTRDSRFRSSLVTHFFASSPDHAGGVYAMRQEGAATNLTLNLDVPSSRLCSTL